MLVALSSLKYQLPFYDNTETMDYDVGGKRSYRSGRQQRGDLKSVASISGLKMDGRHVVLEMSDVRFYSKAKCASP